MYNSVSIDIEWQPLFPALVKSLHPNSNPSSRMSIILLPLNIKFTEVENSKKFKLKNEKEKRFQAQSAF